MKIKDKRGMQLAISTVILLVIGIIVLIGIVSILIMGWDDFKTAIGAAFGNELSKAKRHCAVACAAQNKETYCGEIKFGNTKYANNCLDKKLVDGKPTIDLVPEGCDLTCPESDLI